MSYLTGCSLCRPQHLSGIYRYMSVPCLSGQIPFPVPYSRPSVGAIRVRCHTTRVLFPVQGSHHKRSFSHFCFVKCFSLFSASGIPHFQHEEFLIYSETALEVFWLGIMQCQLRDTEPFIYGLSRVLSLQAGNRYLVMSHQMTDRSIPYRLSGMPSFQL